MKSPCLLLLLAMTACVATERPDAEIATHLDEASGDDVISSPPVEEEVAPAFFVRWELASILPRRANPVRHEIHVTLRYAGRRQYLASATDGERRALGVEFLRHGRGRCVGQLCENKDEYRLPVPDAVMREHIYRDYRVVLHVQDDEEALALRVPAPLILKQLRYTDVPGK